MENRTFSINADTYTLKIENGGKIILDQNIKYIIPIYQRPYSWSHEQIRKFISDIFLSFWGNDGISDSEPMFIGTMQLSEKEKINESELYQQKIIDGQQRLTTFLIFFRILQDKFPTCNNLKNLDFGWLETRVNNGRQQVYLNDFMAKKMKNNDDSLNPYLNNAFIIREILNEEITDDENNPKKFDIEKFTEYIFSNIYFVVIETHAGLSKTLQIFNAINTTGLDLNAGDIFKIRMYEYLRDIKQQKEEVFDDISKLYEKIDDKNNEIGYFVTDMIGILKIYQYYLIAQYNLPNVLYSYAAETFFERLFESIFNIASWEHYNNAKSVELKLSDIDGLIEARYQWQSIQFATIEDLCSIYFIWWSRYSRYWILIIILLFRFKKHEDCIQRMNIFTKQLSKLYIIYSVLYQKSIGEIHSFSYSLTADILKKRFDSIIKSINSKINGSSAYRGLNRNSFEHDISGDIVYNSKTKNILCRLSAMIAEINKKKKKMNPEEVQKLLFESSIDIEHIQSYNDINEEERNKIWNQWGDDINSIGNLIVLEQSINRSIGNKPFLKKVSETPGYKDSHYQSVQNLINEYHDWNLLNCRKRKKKEVKLILEYIFSN